MTEQTDDKTGGSAWLGIVLVFVGGALLLAGLVAYYALTTLPTAERIGILLVCAALGVGVFAMSPLGFATVCHPASDTINCFDPSAWVISRLTSSPAIPSLFLAETVSTFSPALVFGATFARPGFDHSELRTARCPFR